MKFILAHDLARRRAMAAVADAPAGWVITVDESRRNLAVNAALHAKLTEIAQSREWAGKRWDVETWKRLLTAAWGRATGQAVVMLPALDGAGVDIVFRRTSELTQAECRDLLAFIEAWCAETESEAA
jgi:L-alanine-DL-glutamate epimerase-like enolase superfamily enzyme